MNPYTQTIDSSHVYAESLPPQGQFLFWDAGNWETHRDVCEVRLDLDANNDRGRLGPHYFSDELCTTTFSLADQDVRIWTLDSILVDSVRLKQSQSFAAWAFPDDPLFNFSDNGSGGLTISAVSSVGHQEWEALLAEIQLTLYQTTAAGEYTTNAFIYADGIRSDAAFSIIRYRPNLPTVGRDTAHFICPTQVLSATEMFAAGTEQGGIWEPVLPTTGGTSYFQSTEVDYGIYRYIVSQMGCDPDTDLVRFDSLPTLAQRLPLADSIFVVCRDTFAFNPTALGDNSFSFAFHENNSLDVVRNITEDGTYSIYLFDELNGCDGFVDYQVKFMEDTLLLRDTSIWICPDEAATVYGQIIDEAGNYLINSEFLGCSYEYNLTAYDALDYFTIIDTAIAAGEVISIADTTLATGGNFLFSFSSARGCDSIIEVTLDILSSTRAFSHDETTPYQVTNLLDGDTQTFGIYDDGKIVPLAELRIHSLYGQPLFASETESVWCPSSTVARGTYFYRAVTKESVRILSGVLIIQ